MTHNPTPWQILDALFPTLKLAAFYARQIQPHIASRPAKDGYDNMFGAALSDADLSIQTMVEVALLGSFPDIRFYGEEYEQTYNTKYFRAIDLGGKDDYLVTLDPIDGTRFYLDGHNNYQIILGILNWDEFEAVIALTPSQNSFYYALRGKGVYVGSLDGGLNDTEPLKLGAPKPKILLGNGMEFLRSPLSQQYDIIDIATSYSHETQIPNVNGMLNGEVSAAVIRGGKFIDGAALGFLAQEAGHIVTTHSGAALPPLHECSNYERPGLVMAATEEMHQAIVGAIATARK
ncbi:inositol monophosphatase family protein [Vacuolonema iberomarrocanum]|uniref:inositol monophosphatase family protein n=1 Tax=Vacuolonema iberomarrocanum TaxID=3454632 RepID=UPI0019F052DE|nr:inositol monophosphatase family protein [filamentous cyanobacterium LEGE 07170]